MAMTARKKIANDEAMEVLYETYIYTLNGTKRHPDMIASDLSVDTNKVANYLKSFEEAGLVKSFEDWIDGAELGNHYDITSEGVKALEGAGFDVSDAAYLDGE